MFFYSEIKNDKTINEMKEKMRKRRMIRMKMTNLCYPHEAQKNYWF